MVTNILHYYLVLNVLLGLTWLLIKLMKWVTSVSNGRVSFSTLNRWSQVLMMSALILPIAFTFLPKESLPKIGLQIRVPLADVIATPTPAITSKTQITDTFAEIKLTSAPVWYKDISRNEIVLFFLFVGLLVMLLRFYEQSLRLIRILAESVLIRKIGKVQIGISDSIKIPFSTLIGGRAFIIVPMEMVTHAKDFKIILKHEIHHHRNGDTAWIILMELACCAFYLNPFIYFLKKEISEIQEFACDEILIRQVRVSMHEYGQCLVRVAEAARGLANMQAGTTCMGAGPKSPQQLKSFLRRRIEVFRDHQNGQRNRFFSPVLGTMGVLITATIAFGAQKSLQTDGNAKLNKGSAKFNTVVQTETQSILEKYVAKFGAKGGFVVVADPTTGQVLATANVSQIESRRGKAWALSYEMEPASAMKGIIAAAAIDKNLIQANEKMNCENGKYDYGGHIYRDWKPFENLTAAESIMYSSNICGIKIGERLGTKGLESALKNFGFGSGGSAAEFPEARTGRYPAQKVLADTDYIPLIATGYTATPGFYVTPLEITFAYGAIANNGKLVKPQLADHPEGETIRQVISAETATKMKQILADTVKSGTGKNAQSKLYSTAGKTSTAYSPKSAEHPSLGGERGIAGFVGFAPVNEPKLVVYVGIIDPTNSADKNPHGNEHAAPVFKDVVETVLKKMKVEPDL